MGYQQTTTSKVLLGVLLLLCCIAPTHALLNPRAASLSFSLHPHSNSHSHLASATPTSAQIQYQQPLDQVANLLSQIYGHDRVRRTNAAMAKHGYLQKNPEVDKRHMTYGELPLELFQDVLHQLAARLSSTNAPQGTFIDLGSGVGRLAIASSLLAPPGVWTEAVGVEIVPNLHDSALDAYDRALDMGLLSTDQQPPISFVLGDVFDPASTTLQKASAVFAYSTTWQCDEDLVMHDLSDSLAQSLQTGAIVAMTDRKLKHPFVLEGTPILGQNAEKGGPEATSMVYVYRLTAA